MSYSIGTPLPSMREFTNGACESKEKYSKSKAKAVSISCAKRTSRRLRVYECRVCHYYHLTSQEKETRKLRMKPYHDED